MTNLLKQKWHNSALKKLLNIEIPLIQAPMAGGYTTPELIAAVSKAGGLGSLAAGFLQPAELKSAIEKIRQQTKHPFAVNLFVPGTYQTSLNQQQQMLEKLHSISHSLNINLKPAEAPFTPLFDEQMEIVIQEKAPVVSFTFGIPALHWLKKLKANGTIIIGTATSLAEAKALEHAGVDVIAAQSMEAGGHRGTFIGEAYDALIGGFSLIPLLADHIKLPIIAAGGIMDARGIAAALTLGASGVQMGTAFLNCTEAGTHPTFKNKLSNLTDDETTLTKAFSGKYARGIRNQYINQFQNTDVLDYPVQDALTKPLRKAAAAQNNIEFMALWASQSAYLSTAQSAKTLIEKIKHEMSGLID